MITVSHVTMSRGKNDNKLTHDSNLQIKRVNEISEKKFNKTTIVVKY